MQGTHVPVPSALSQTWEQQSSSKSQAAPSGAQRPATHSPWQNPEQQSAPEKQEPPCGTQTTSQALLTHASPAAGSQTSPQAAQWVSVPKGVSQPVATSPSQSPNPGS